MENAPIIEPLLASLDVTTNEYDSIRMHCHDLDRINTTGAWMTYRKSSLNYVEINLLTRHDPKIISRIDVREEKTANSNTLTDITSGLEDIMQAGFLTVKNELENIR